MFMVAPVLRTSDDRHTRSLSVGASVVVLVLSGDGEKKRLILSFGLFNGAKFKVESN